MAIGVSLAIDEELQDFNVWETLTTATATVPSPQDTPNRHSLRQGQEEAESSIPARKRKRKWSKRKRVTEDTPQRPARKDDKDEDKDQRRPAMERMSGRRHSGFRNRA